MDTMAGMQLGTTLSRTEAVWLARLRVAPQIVNYVDSPAWRLARRGLATIATEQVKISPAQFVARVVARLAESTS